MLESDPEWLCAFISACWPTMWHVREASCFAEICATACQTRGLDPKMPETGGWSNSCVSGLEHSLKSKASTMIRVG